MSVPRDIVVAWVVYLSTFAIYAAIDIAIARLERKRFNPQRIIGHATVFVPAVLLFSLPPPGTAVFGAILAFLAGREMFAATGGSTRAYEVHAQIAAALVPFVVLYDHSLVAPYLLLASVSIATHAILRLEYQRASTDLALWVLCAAFAVAVSYFVELRQLTRGFALAFSLMYMINVGDSAGLMVGKLFGKKKLLPSLSPGKTVAGTVGVVTSTIVASAVLWAALLRFQPLGWVLGVAAAISVASQLGDLTLSVFKRDLGIKDYGTLIKGHGGVLDRFDSLLFATPLYYYLLTLTLSAS